MLIWKGLDKRFLKENQWALMIWSFFLVVGLIFISFSKYGQINTWLSRHYSSSLGFFLKYYTRLGEEWILVPIGLVLVFYIKNLSFLIRLAATFLINTMVTVTLKFLIFNYDRPKLALQNFDLHFTKGVLMNEYNSFPSGHSSAAFAMALAIAFWFKNKLLSLLVLLLAVGVGFSRIYLQQHFIEDVIGGAIIGLFAALIASQFSWVAKK